MSIEEVEIALDNVPVGLLPEVFKNVSLVCEITSTVYFDRTESDDSYSSSFFAVSEIYPYMNKVKVVYTGMMEDNLIAGFTEFIDKYIDDRRKDYELLDNLWSLEYDECK